MLLRTWVSPCGKYTSQSFERPHAEWIECEGDY